MREFLIKNLPTFLELTPSNNLEELMILEENVDGKKEKQKIKLNLQSIIFKPLHFDTFDSVVNHELSSKIKYDIIKTKKELIMNFELPGMSPEDMKKLIIAKAQKNPNGNCWMLKGDKIRLTEGDGIEMVNTRTYGQFEMNTPTIPFHEIEFRDFRKPLREQKDGLLQFRWELKFTDPDDWSNGND